jgi:hypothetical protein
MRHLALAALLAPAALGAAACGSPCEDLATRICNCQPAGALRDSCIQGMKNELSNDATKPTEATQQFCASRLASCPDPNDDKGQCDRLKTAKGKQDCGLAAPQ